jgi:hypothetical protein
MATAALRQKQSIRSIETVKADTARKNWSISIAFSRWREDRWMHDPPKSPTSALALEIFFQGYPKNYGWKLRFRRSQLWSAGDVPQTA